MERGKASGKKAGKIRNAGKILKKPKKRKGKNRKKKGD